MHRLVIDDVRTFAFDAHYARTGAEGIAALEGHRHAGQRIDELWLDYRLGAGETIRPVVSWLGAQLEVGAAPDIGVVVVHTSDPAGAREVVRALEGWVAVRRVDARDFMT